MALERVHAILSASSSARWLSCPPSARLSEGVPDRPTTASRDGDALHAVSAARIALECGLLPPEKALAEVHEVETTHAHVLGKPGSLPVMTAYTSIACGKIRAALSRPGARIALEQPLDLSRHIPDGSGIADLLICADGTLEVIDFKSGRGPVYAPHNTQLMLYALGALGLWHDLEIHEVCMTIIQPRIFNRSTWVLPRRALGSWAKTRLRRTARLAFKGWGEFHVGKHCRYCLAKTVCNKYTPEKEQNVWESP